MSHNIETGVLNNLIVCLNILNIYISGCEFIDWWIHSKWSDKRNQEKYLMIILVLVGSNMRIVLSTCGNVDVVQNLFDFGILKNWE